MTNDDREMIVTVTVKGGEPRQLSDLAPKTQERIFRGLRNFLREQGDAVVLLPPRQLAEAQSVFDELIARMSDVAWESPPCVQHSKKEGK